MTEEAFSKETLDKMMKRIENLLARADHPNTPKPEADLARKRAEITMQKYRIAEEDLINSGDLKVDVISVQNKFINYAPSDSEFGPTYRTLLNYAAHHTGCRMVYGGVEWDETGRLQRQARLFGYEADIRYAELLFNNARLLFGDRMEPKVDPDLSDEDNVYRMRSAGMERIRIAVAMGYGDTTSATGKVTRLYKKACAARGEDAALTGKGNSVKNFRDIYVEEFTTRFWERLWDARQAVDAELEGGGLVLHGREERVAEAVYLAYPHLRPTPSDLAAKPKPRTAKQIAADERRMMRERAERMRKRYSVAGMAGAVSGRSAADEVSIKGQTPKRRLGE